jgi:hypothetical protein
MFKKVSIRNRLLLLAALSIIAVVGMAIFGYTQINLLNTDMGHLTDETLPNYVALSRAYANVVKLANQMRASINEATERH